MQHQRRTSDFGGFVSAAPSSSSTRQSPTHFRRQREPILQTGDLLGSFDDDEWTEFSKTSMTPHRVVQPRNDPNSLIDLDDISSGQPAVIHLPPRPDEMSEDYIHPTRSPRRSSQPHLIPGPSSPPHIPHSRDFFSGKKHDMRTAPASYSTEAGPSRLASMLSSPISAKAAANKWRRSVDRYADEPSVGDFDDWPSLVTHDNPFAPPEHPHIHLPPSGAPGFIHTPGPKITHRSEDLPPSLYLQGRRVGTIPVLDEPTAISLQRHLPARQRLSKTWSLICASINLAPGLSHSADLSVSLDQHGASLSSLYRHADNASSKAQGYGCVLIMLDGDGRRFGAFINENIVRREGAYYGSGESFLFRIPNTGPPGSPPAVFRWTGKNQYFSLCEGAFVSFGGGSGTYGLIFDSTFSKCSSATCPTFDNEVLCSAEPLHSDKATYFDCVGLEVWATMPL